MQRNTGRSQTSRDLYVYARCQFPDPWSADAMNVASTVLWITNAIRTTAASGICVRIVSSPGLSSQRAIHPVTESKSSRPSTEADRRMKEDYRDKDVRFDILKRSGCRLTFVQNYYQMGFDQGMILDATKGSVSRFVNHSCEPNCKMLRRFVEGQPRIALFAGDNGISTGEELTYDYNFK
jgi:hypothetical protein